VKLLTKEFIKTHVFRYSTIIFIRIN